MNPLIREICSRKVTSRVRRLDRRAFDCQHRIAHKHPGESDQHARDFQQPFADQSEPSSGQEQEGAPHRERQDAPGRGKILACRMSLPNNTRPRKGPNPAVAMKGVSDVMKATTAEAMAA